MFLFQIAKKDKFTKLQEANRLNVQTTQSFALIKQAVKDGKIEVGTVEEMVEKAVELELISKAESSKLIKAYKLKQDVISVDSFKVKTYKELR